VAESLGWWAISGEDILDLLKRAHAGEDPDMLYIEAYANAESVRVEPDDG
jgi:hypothetical protein